MYCCSGRDRLGLETIVVFYISVIPCIVAQAGTDWVSKQLPSVIFQWFHVLLLRQGQIGFGNNCRLWYSSYSMFYCSGRDRLDLEKLSLIFQWFHVLRLRQGQIGCGKIVVFYSPVLPEWCSKGWDRFCLETIVVFDIPVISLLSKAYVLSPFISGKLHKRAGLEPPQKITEPLYSVSLYEWAEEYL